jgi:hypothetical protein
MWQGRPPRVSRARRQQITQEARRIHALRRTQGWTVDQIQDEILQRFYGEEFPGEARMLAHGWNAGLVREGLQALSEAAGLDASGLQDADVLRWLRGETYPRDYLDRLCRLFQCHQAALGWPVAQTLPAIDYTPRQRPPEAIDTLARQMGLMGEVPAQLPEGDLLTVRLGVMINGEQATMPIRVPRAVLLEAGGAELLTALAGHPDPDERQRVTAVIKRRHPADMRSVAHFDAVLASYRTLEDLIGPRRLLDPVRSLTEVIDDLRLDAPAAVQRSLLALAVRYWQFAGWLRVDLGDNRAAERAYDTALARATESGTPALMRYVLACKSEQALMDGRPDAALVLAQEAQRDPETLTPAALAWAADLEARAHALNGDETHCQHQLDNARSLRAASAAGPKSPRGCTTSSMRRSRCTVGSVSPTSAGPTRPPASWTPRSPPCQPNGSVIAPITSPTRPEHMRQTMSPSRPTRWRARRHSLPLRQTLSESWVSSVAFVAMIPAPSANSRSCSRHFYRTTDLSGGSGGG